MAGHGHSKEAVFLTRAASTSGVSEICAVDVEAEARDAQRLDILDGSQSHSATAFGFALFTSSAVESNAANLPMRHSIGFFRR